MARGHLLLGCLTAWGLVAGWAGPAFALDAPSTLGHGVASVPLRQAAGPAVSLAAFRGRWVWLYLGFANCPDLCPNTLSEMAVAHQRLARPLDVQGLFVSVDPNRDTPELLKKYTAYFDASFLGLTGDRPSLEALAASLGTAFDVRPAAGPNTSYQVAHPNRIFVIDPQGHLAGAYLPDDAAPGGDGGLTAYFEALRQGGGPVAGAPSAHAPSTAELCGLPAASVGGAGAHAGMMADPAMARQVTLGSGTSVLPAAAPMRMASLRWGEWLWMAHGNAIAGYTYQDGPRGALAHVGENWGMLMGSRPLGPGVLDLRAMGSLEPLSVSEGGTPQLFQTGESYHFNPLVDRQHPHDLIMELSGRYTWVLNQQLSLFAYGGPAGEPALGPTAAMHRPSAADNAWTPLAHHLQDSTHIAYGVGTLGARMGDFQLEGSVFNGREPDEYRYDIDWGPLDSVAARLSYFPGRNWVAQVSTGFLHEPELLHPGDAYRTTASLMHVSDTAWGPCSTSLIWGQNTEVSNAASGTYAPLTLESYGLESQLDLLGRDHLYGRLELVDKDGLPPGPPLNHTIHRIEALTLGGVHDLGVSPRFELGLGGDVTLYGLDEALKAQYGFNPFSFRVYLRLRPPTMWHG